MLVEDELIEGRVSTELLTHMENILVEEIQEGERIFQEVGLVFGYFELVHDNL